jgi:hypothetical protein
VYFAYNSYFTPHGGFTAQVEVGLICANGYLRMQSLATALNFL